MLEFIPWVIEFSPWVLRVFFALKVFVSKHRGHTHLGAVMSTTALHNKPCFCPYKTVFLFQKRTEFIWGIIIKQAEKSPSTDFLQVFPVDLLAVPLTPGLHRLIRLDRKSGFFCIKTQIGWPRGGETANRSPFILSRFFLSYLSGEVCGSGHSDHQVCDRVRSRGHPDVRTGRHSGSPLLPSLFLPGEVAKSQRVPWN